VFRDENPYSSPYEQPSLGLNSHKLVILWWPVLGSSQWPLPKLSQLRDCESDAALAAEDS
jgi:hypothetical protein